jgi:hypothetical protein
VFEYIIVDITLLYKIKQVKNIFYRIKNNISISL